MLNEPMTHQEYLICRRINRLLEAMDSNVRVRKSRGLMFLDNGRFYTTDLSVDYSVLERDVNLLDYQASVIARVRKMSTKNMIE